MRNRDRGLSSSPGSKHRTASRNAQRGCYSSRMRKMLHLSLILLAASILCSFAPARSGAAAENGRKGIDEFNRRFLEACRSMDHKAAVELWTEDGADLLLGMEPMTGKQMIAQWLHGLDEQMKGAKVTQCDVDWQQIN